MKQLSDENPALTPSHKQKTVSQCYRGIVIHDGFAIGLALIKPSGFPEVPDTTCESPELEIERLNNALKKAIGDLNVTLSQLDQNSESYAIFSSHVLMMQDAVLLDGVRKVISKGRKTAEFAWVSELRRYNETWKSAAKGSIMEQRSSDILDIAIRVHRILDHSESDTIATEGILVTQELSASDAMSLDPNYIKGVVSERGNETSHSAILVRSKGIPAVFGIRNLCSNIDKRSWIAIDGETGDVHVGFDPVVEKSIISKIQLHSGQQAYFASQVNVPAIFEGKPVELLANVSSAEQIQKALQSGAIGVGLFRTEFLYTNRIAAPSEEVQYKKYVDAIKSVDGHKIVIRTADFGGDKPISYLKWDIESNPFLGNRGIRYSLSEQTLFRTQLRALIQASAHGDVHVMFPMISTLDEILAAKSALRECKKDLEAKGKTTGTVHIGVMIEVPAAALQIYDILSEVDFVSIGTNDLIQYLMAADRTLDTLGLLTSPFQPAVLKLIRDVIQAANDKDIPVAICGEMAGDIRLTSLLLAFGLREFSMSAERISRVKEVIRNTSSKQTTHLLERFSACKTENDVRELLQ
jgi:phosphoenolpyruvate-protein phosphotransferase (PTS system enzyme I)